MVPPHREFSWARRRYYLLFSYTFTTPDPGQSPLQPNSSARRPWTPSKPRLRKCLVGPVAEGMILVLREARELIRRSKLVESEGPSGGGPIHKRFLGTQTETRALITLVPDRVVQDVYFRYGVIYVRKWVTSVSAPFAPTTPDSNNHSNRILYGWPSADGYSPRAGPSPYPLRYQFCHQRPTVVDVGLVQLRREAVSFPECMAGGRFRPTAYALMRVATSSLPSRLTTRTTVLARVFVAPGFRGKERRVLPNGTPHPQPRFPYQHEYLSYLIQKSRAKAQILGWLRLNFWLNVDQPSLIVSRVCCGGSKT